MRYTKIVFYNDCYDGDLLIWKREKEYNIAAESKDLYFCECEPFAKKVNNKLVEQTNYAIDKNILNMYYVL